MHAYSGCCEYWKGLGKALAHSITRSQQQLGHGAAERAGKMSSVEDFKIAVKETLSETGAMAQMQAQLRSRILNALDGSSARSQGVKQPPETYLINELVREYLDFQGYRAAASVFEPEAGLQPEQRLSRECLCSRLGVTDGPATQQLPLLYALTARAQGLQQGNGQAASVSRAALAQHNARGV